jgi:hypothetical protein
LDRNPFGEQAFKALHIQLGLQQPKRRVQWRLAEFGAQHLVEHLPVTFRKLLYRQQLHPPLQEENTPPHPGT